MSATESRRVTQVMSLSREEFVLSMAAFLVSEAVLPRDTLRVPVGGGCVDIGYRELPGVLLGGLLALPRAEVTLDFSDVGEADQRAFLRRFEIAFQRGGG